MRNLHLLLDEANKHTPKGFDNVGAKNFRPWKDELSESTYTENFLLPRAINFVDGTVAPPTTVNGDIYVLIGSGTEDAGWGTSVFGDWTRATNTIFTPITPLAGTRCFDSTSGTWKEFNGSNWVAGDANTTNLAIANITATNLDVTSDTGTDATVPAATVSDAGLMTAAKFSEVVANNAKVSNVSTNLSEGTTTNTTVVVESSDGLNVELQPATTLRAGVQTKTNFDAVTANTAKTSNATHTSEVTGNAALTVDKLAITNKANVAVDALDLILISDNSDGGNLKSISAGEFLGASSNLYTADGALLAARTVTMAGFNLAFSGGKVMVGVGTPTSILQVQPTAATTNLRVQAPNGTDSFRVYTSNTTSELTMLNAGAVKNYITSGGSSYFTGGNIGIGTTTPNSTLTIKPTSASTNFRIQAPNASESIRMYTSNTESNIDLFRSGSLKIKIDTWATGGSYFNAGKVGFGLSTGINAAVHVKGDSSTSGGAMIVENLAGTKIIEARNAVELGFFGVTAIARPTTGITAAAFVANTSGIVDDTATYGGYTGGQMAAAMIAFGLLT